MNHNEDINFYKNLTAFNNFTDLSKSEHFHKVPDNWYILITDVRGSTKAIQKGQYKNVNLIGASSIAAALEAMSEYEFPFVFGGDGATMLIAESHLQKVCQNLRALQSLSKNSFNLELRAGYVAVKDLYQQGYSLQIGKYELSNGNYLAQLKGSAIAEAEKRIKNKLHGATVLEPLVDSKPQIQGVSCRLNPMNSQNGVILSLLCTPQNPDIHKSEEALNKVLSELLKILNNSFQEANPVKPNNVKWSTIPETTKNEIIISYDGSQSFVIHFIKKFLHIVMANLMLIFDIPAKEFKPLKYKSELILNSDYKKYDGTLRMVIDCTLDQAYKIETFFKDLHKQNEIFYGIHRSDKALMTCMVQNASHNQHTHFIDGSDGGYAMAALELKKQMGSLQRA